MEARTTLRRSAVSMRMFAVIAAVLAAFMLGAGGGYIAKALSASSAPATHYSAPGNVNAPAPAVRGAPVPI
jgi:hypothetical protein